MDHPPILESRSMRARPGASRQRQDSRCERRASVRGGSAEISHGYDGLVLDLLFLGIVIVFFALAVAFVRGCDRIAGSADTEARR